MHKKLRNCILAASLGLLLPFTPARSAGFQADPASACAFLAEHGLRTRGGYRETGSVFQCRSQRRNLISGGRLNNSIRFLARGDAGKVNQLNLELQVNSRTAVQRAHRSLVEHAETLFRVALNTEMPAEIEDAILSGVHGVWEVQGNSVSLERLVLAGSGYELRLRIE